MLTWKVGSAIQRELILWSDSYIVLPYDILFLREVVHNAIYGKREAKQIYMEELGDLAGQIVCTTTEQADFIRKLLKVIEEKPDVSFNFFGGTGYDKRFSSKEKAEGLTDRMHGEIKQTLEFARTAVIANLKKETKDLKRQFDEIHD